ncbi:MAG: citrate transporter [Oscillospiraceae bacterium]
MSTVIGIILIITFIAFAIYAAKGGNLMIGFFIMAVLWAGLAAIAGVTVWSTTSADVIDINNGIFEKGPELYGASAAVIIFGSWFGEIMVQTGIARTIIRKAVELGGDRPALTSILLSIVVCIIFCSAYGAGAVVAIGSIVFPILISLGIPKPLATASYLMAVGSALYINRAWFSLFTTLMPDINYDSTYLTFAIIAVVLQLVIIGIMTVITLHKTKVRHAWAAKLDGENIETKNVNTLACLTPLIPPLLSAFAGFQAITSILVAVIWALIFTGNIKSWNNVGRLVQKTFQDGVSSIGLVLGFLMMLQMYQRASKVCSSLLAPILSPIMPTNLFLLFVIFGVLAALALFRGPLTVWGAGAATLGMMQGTGIYPSSVLFPLFLIPTTTINGSMCPTQSWCLWGISYTKVTVKEYLKQCLPYALITAFLLNIIAYFIFVA